jgi:zinc protease
MSMQRPFSVIVCAVLALAGCTSRSKPPDSAVMTVEPLKFTQRTLANGLRVYALRDSGTANVSVHVWYDVGSKDDPAGRSGFAHLFEHIMFKATRNMPAENIDRLTEDVGGFNNASTYDDLTNYYEVVPANQLERVLWAESERMGSLVVDQATFTSERDVVKEEFRQRILAAPYGKLMGLYVAQANFSVHPYGRPGIGSIEDLNAATVDDVRAFHATYYRPDNAVLVVSGNFEPATLDRWVDQYFSAISKPATAIPRVTAVEPQRNGARELTVYESNTPLPAVTVSFPAPNARSADLPALIVMDAILSKGESSRLYQSLVYRQQIAAEAFTNFEVTRDPGAYTLAAILSEGKSPAAGLAALQAEIAAIKSTPVTAAELDEAKNELLASTVKQRETAFGRAFELADSVIRYGDATYADQLLSSISAVTAADIQRVANAVLDEQQRVTINYLSADSKPKDAKADLISTAKSIEAHTLSADAHKVAVVTLAPIATRVKAPSAGAAVSATLATPVERTLTNGLRVIVASKRNLPLLSAELRVLTGSASDPSGLAGTASLAADLLTKGTATRSATEIARQIESLGSTLEVRADTDTSAVSLEMLSARASDTLAIAADVARNPAFAEAELARQRQQALDGLAISLKQPAALARSALSRLLFGSGPYGNVTTLNSLKSIKRGDVLGFHQSYWRPDNAVLVISGDVSTDDGFKLAEKFFGAWERPAMPLLAAATAVPGAAATAAGTAGKRAVFIDLANSGQAAVLIGMHGMARNDKDFIPALVTNSVLGGGYSARLGLEIRIKRGLSYSAGSGLEQRRQVGSVIASAQTKNETAAEVAGLMNMELRRLGNSAVSTEELAARQANLIGTFGRDVETTSGLAGQLSQLAAFQLPLSQLQSYIADVSAVTPAQVQAIGTRIFDPDNTSLVIVGDGAKAFGAVRKLRPDVVRILASKLNLDKPELQ